MAGRALSSDHVALGRAVRELRKRRGVSQVVAAFDAGVNAKYVGDVERGTLNPTVGMLLRIVRTLGFSLAELVEVYDRHLAEVDPQAGRDVPLCPTPAALQYREDSNARDRGRNQTAMARGRMRSWT